MSTEHDNVKLDTCKVKLLTGKRLGLICGRKSVKNVGFCHYHTRNNVTLKSKVSSENEEKTKNNVDTCRICFVENNSDSITLECKHTFHNNCLIYLTNNTCPLCRSKLKELPDTTKSIIKERVKNITKINELENRIILHQKEYAKLEKLIIKIKNDLLLPIIFS